MAKSLRSKRKKRLRTLKREIAEPYYQKKEEQKWAALAAPDAPTESNNSAPNAMEIEQAGEDPSKQVENREAKMQTDDEGAYYGVSLKPSKRAMKKAMRKKGKYKKFRKKTRKL